MIIKQLRNYAIAQVYRRQDQSFVAAVCGCEITLTTGYLTMGSRLLIGNLSLEAEELALKELFSQVGIVESVELVIDPHTGKRKGFAFVEMSSRLEAQKALSLDGTNFGGRLIIVNSCQSTKETSGRSFFSRFFQLLHA